MPEKNEQTHTGESIEELQQTVVELSQEVRVLRDVLDEIREDFRWALRNGHSESIEETVTNNEIDSEIETPAEFVEEYQPKEPEKIIVEEPFVIPPNKTVKVYENCTQEVTKRPQNTKSLHYPMIVGQCVFLFLTGAGIAKGIIPAGMFIIHAKPVSISLKTVQKSFFKNRLIMEAMKLNGLLARRCLNTLKGVSLGL